MTETSQPSTPAPSDFNQATRDWRHWWQRSVIGTINQAEVISRRREECALSSRYLFMTAMSGGIAILGLLLSSPAVVIGAMLLSPLMDPIMGLGFALAIGDYRWLRQSAKSLALGSLLAIGLCAVIVFLSPLQDITPEIASRTRPSLFDLFVALFSAMAGAYSMIRGREGTIVGVAIATALMPPLAVVGYGIATLNGTVFLGSLLLFVTNLLTIALTAWGMARLYGFRTSLSEKQTRYQSFVVVIVFIALALPLGFSLRQIAWEANAVRQVRGELADTFGKAARLSPPEINFDSDPIQVAAFVWTTKIDRNAEASAERHLTSRLGRPVDVQLKQFLVSDEQGAEAAQLASAKATQDAAASNRVAQLGDRLALAAGVGDSEVVVDTGRRSATVRARPLPGADFATYRELERRIAATDPDWRIALIPPMSRLPTVPVVDGAPDADTMALVAWAASRLGIGLVVSGRGEEADEAEKSLADAGIEVRRGRSDGPLRIDWDELQEPAG